MLPSIVGPPLKGVADFKAPEANAKAENSRDEKKAGSDSFGQMLGAKITPKAKDSDIRTPSRDRAPLKNDSTDKVDRAERAERDDLRKPESDDKAEKVTATRDNGVQKKSKGNGQRENAILNFMDSFESEFGVPPTKIVEAMAKLKASDQAESPEATADQVIGQLNLDDQQEDQAKAMYMGLLAQLAQIDKQPQQQPLPQKPEGQAFMFGGATATAAAAHDRFSSAQGKREALNSSLDHMNQKFWMKGGAPGAVNAASTDAPLADKLAQMSIQDKMMQPQGLQIDESLMNQRLQQPVPGMKNLGQENLQEASEGENPEAALAALVAAARAAKGHAEMKEMASEFDDASSSADTGASQAPDMSHSKVPLKAESQHVEGATQNHAKGFEFGKNSHQQQGDANGGLAHSAKGEILAKAKGAEKADFKQALGLDGVNGQPVPLKQEAVAGGAVIAGAQAAPAPTKAENEANVRQLMNQAQYLIKRGGGEMKVEMTPEGLGKINMKVLVQDGKVNVQMAADTPEAKKTLESGLSELKNSLAAHKLSMDHVKIDVVGSANTDNSAQNQMNQNNGGREQARQFWNNFGDNFGSGNQDRSSFLDVPNTRAYPKQRSDQAIGPIETASVNKYAAAGKGKGLNLVA